MPEPAVIEGAGQARPDLIPLPAHMVGRAFGADENGRLILNPGMGHPAAGRQFQRDVLAFLRDGR